MGRPGDAEAAEEEGGLASGVVIVNFREKATIDPN
jgi:hypothetical protein